MVERFHFDVVVIGGGPAGQKAAIQAAKAGATALVVDRQPAAGGECVVHGTIPSKTLRDLAVRFSDARSRLKVELPDEAKLTTLLARLDEVVAAHQEFLGAQLARNRVEFWHGRARFLSSNEVETLAPDGTRKVARGKLIVVAVGSRPRTPAEVPVDHEHLLDSDSILSLAYLPKSLVVLGAGVIACEYASIFAALGVAVTIVDRGERPMPFLEAELTDRFVARFERYAGCRYLGGRHLKSSGFDGLAQVVTELDDGTVLRTEKLLCALGRRANLEGLAIEAAGLVATPRGLLEVDADFRTKVPHIYGVGDVVGPPALASSAMQQGRRAVRHGLGLPLSDSQDVIPTGIYTIPEISCIGMTEAEAVAKFGGAIVGRSSFHELARGQIAGITDGLVKLVCEPNGRKLVGAQIFGETATELIHIAQMGLVQGCEVDVFVDHVFNFPTMAEAYRVAAFDVLRKRALLAEALVTRR